MSARGEATLRGAVRARAAAGSRGIARARAVLLAAAAALALPALAADAPPRAPAAASSAAGAAARGAAVAAPEDAREQPTLKDDRDVIEASEKWLRLLDRGELGAAWDVSAALLHDQVTRANWIKGIGEARKPFGKLKLRHRDRFARAHQLPGAPEGDYAIVQFASEFANGKHATEQLTWTLEADGGIWRVSGYYIR